eukprot:TRINITY_DN495_c0_g1_i5.p1 TRINITY_DN495_c0_g1~~TRINITY_DN495_c0_g1_i5.p1  ORF type:complete len:215 (+),score=109.65 TRINITY_DN495_c0_g1_i5:115-759(+)
MAPTLKVVYFPVPGKGEPLRLTATLGDLELENTVVDGATWGSTLKATVAPAQMPLLYVDGKQYGQSLAQLRYLGKLAGLYPEDPLVALEVDELVDYAQEVFAPIAKTFAIQNDEEKQKARAAAVAEGGDAHKWLVYLDKRLEGKKYAVGDALSIADVVIFTQIQPLRAGWLDGVPKDCLDAFKNIQAHRDLIANLDKVKAKYADATGVQAIYKA